LIAAYLALNATDARRIRRANELGARGFYSQAIAVAGKVSSGSQRGDALRVDGYSDLALGRDRDAIAAFRQALRHTPQDWVLHRDLASALLLVGARASARVEMGRALALNPKLVLPPRFVRS
jgi:Flp pilus assembly protein TadD